MIYIGATARAFTNMLRAAAHDPIWAITRVIIGPILAWRYLFGALLLVIVVGVTLTYLSNYLLPQSWEYASHSVIGFFGLVLIFRLATAPMILHFGSDDSQAGTHGTARFANERETAPMARGTSGLLIGRAPKSRKLLRYDGPAHLLTIAPTRTGKGVGTVIPNLLTANRSVVCVDPKGDNARIARRARNRFGPVHVIDPFSVTGVPSASFNPVARLDPGGIDVAEDAATLADALVYDAPGEAGEAHWNDEAKALIGGILLYIAGEEPPERRTLSTLREHLTAAPDVFVAFLKRMQESRTAGGLVARAANRHLGKSDREATGVLSSAQRHTHFLDSPRMTAVLDRSDFSFAELKNRTATVFLVLPPDRLGAYARWLRLMVAQSLQETVRVQGDRTVLYLLDEFAALGYLPPVERAMGLMAGYGVQLWPILQDIHQLQAVYGPRSGTFMSNAGVLQVFGVNDQEGARLVSDLLGPETVVFQTASVTFNPDRSNLSLAAHHTGRPILMPDEVRRLSSDQQLLFVVGQRPILARKLRYYADPEFEGLFDGAA